MQIANHSSGLPKANSPSQSRRSFSPEAALSKAFPTDSAIALEQYQKRIDRIDDLMCQFEGTGATANTPEGPMKRRGDKALVRTQTGFDLQQLSITSIPSQTWAKGTPRKDGFLARFDRESQTISVKEVRVRPHLTGFGKARHVTTIGDSTTYTLDLTKKTVEQLKVVSFEGKEPEFLFSGFRNP